MSTPVACVLTMLRIEHSKSGDSVLLASGGDGKSTENTKWSKGHKAVGCIKWWI